MQRDIMAIFAKKADIATLAQLVGAEYNPEE